MEHFTTASHDRPSRIDYRFSVGRLLARTMVHLRLIRSNLGFNTTQLKHTPHTAQTSQKVMM
jgi:hypothetical protein